MIGIRTAASVVTLAAVVSLTACGGGGGGGSASVPAPHASAAASAAPSGPTAQVVFRIGSGSKSTTSTARTPNFVSPSTQSATVSLQGQTPPLATINVTLGAPNCTGDGTGGVVCTASVAAPSGTDTFVINTYDAQNGTGNLLSTGTVVATIALNATNTVSLVLSGVVASTAVILGSSSVQAGTPATVAVTVVAYDAKQNVIIGPGNYSTPVGLTSSDTSNVTHLSTTQVTGPGTSVTLSYTGASSIGATITPMLGSTAGTAATFTPTGYAFTPFSLTSNSNKFTNVTAVGPDGNLWFAQPGTIGFITPAGASTAFTSGNSVPNFDILALAAGPDGAVWFGDIDGQVGSITTGGTVALISSFATGPTGCGSGGQKVSIVRRNAQVMVAPTACGPINWMIPGPGDGKLWVSDDSGMIGSVNLQTGTLTEYDITTMQSWPPGAFAEPVQIAFGSDGAIYAADPHGLLDRITVSNGVVTDATQLPLTTGCTSNGQFGTFGLAIGTDGTIWTGDQCSNLVAVPLSNFSSSAVQAWSIAGLTNFNSLQYLIPSAAGIWATDGETNTVYRITNTTVNNQLVPAISTLTPLPPVALAYALAIGSDGNLWVDGDSSPLPDLMVRVAYGVPATGSTLSLVRSLPAANRTASRTAAALGRHARRYR